MRHIKITSLFLTMVLLFTMISPFNAFATYTPKYPTITNYLTGDKDNIREAEILVDKAYAEMNLASKTDRVSQLLTIYHWVTSNMHYESGDDNTQYGTLSHNNYMSPLYIALTRHVGNCTGYAQLFQFFCDNAVAFDNQLNINNVSAVTKIGHIWNIAEVDGYWYSIDCSGDQDALFPWGFLEPLNYNELTSEYQTAKFKKEHPSNGQRYDYNSVCPNKNHTAIVTNNFNFECKRTCGSPNITFEWTMPANIKQLSIYENCYDKANKCYSGWVCLGTFEDPLDDGYKNTKISPTWRGDGHRFYVGYNDNITSGGCTISGDVEFCIIGTDETYQKYQSPSIKIDYNELINSTHQWGPETVINPTCTAEGSTTKTCSVCNSVSVVKSEALGHQYESVISETPSTCSQNGSRSFHCTRCDKDITETIDRLPHTKVIDKAVKPTFAKAGKTEGSHCRVCGAIIKAQKPVAKLKPSATTLSKVTSPKSKQLKVIWKKQTKNTTGYVIQYSTSKSFKKGNKTIKVKSNKTTAKTIKKLKSKKKYYVRVRTYKSVNGKMYYSAWSKAKTVTTKK